MVDDLKSIPKFDDIVAGRPIEGPPSVEMVPISKMRVPSSYQREILRRGKNTIRKILKDFQWARFGVITTAYDEAANIYCIIDGQHRAAALKTVGFREAPCLVIRDHSQVRQAKDFIAINTVRTSLTAQQIYRARLVAGEKDACELASLAERCGIRFRAGQANKSVKYLPGDTHAVGACQALIAKDPAGLETVLKLLGPLDGGAGLAPITARLLRGVFRLYGELGGFSAEQAEVLVTGLKRVPIMILSSQVGVRRAQDGETIPEAWAEVLRSLMTDPEFLSREVTRAKPQSLAVVDIPRKRASPPPARGRGDVSLKKDGAWLHLSGETLTENRAYAWQGSRAHANAMMARSRIKGLIITDMANRPEGGRA